MVKIQGLDEWSYFPKKNGKLRPGFDVVDSEIGDFAIVVNSAGGVDTKDYAEQLQLLLEGLTLYSESVLLRVEVDSKNTAHLDISQRVLEIGCPIEMESVGDHLGLRKKITAAQRTIGQRPEDTGGNGTRRIKMHIKFKYYFDVVEFLNGLLTNGELRMNKSREATTAKPSKTGFRGSQNELDDEVLTNQEVTQASDVVRQIHTLTKDEIQKSLDEWLQVGRDLFFARHDVNPAFKYKIAAGEELFDAKAIVVGSLRKFRPQLGAFKTSIFNGNAATIAEPLRRLGFNVLDMELDEIEVEDDRHEREILNRGLEGPVEKIQLVKSRRGQGKFRDNVESREPKCRVTGVTNPRYLRASHIRPWRKSTDQEKIDGNNGLMLAPHIDFLFDRGFISFEDDGNLIVSNQIEDDVLDAWGIPSEMNVGPFSSEQSVYLKFHRENELKK